MFTRTSSDTSWTPALEASYTITRNQSLRRSNFIHHYFRRQAFVVNSPTSAHNHHHVTARTPQLPPPPPAPRLAPPSATPSLPPSSPPHRLPPRLPPGLPCPAIHATDLSRPALTHDTVCSFVQHFALPHSFRCTPLGPMTVSWSSSPPPENALTLLTLTSYHTCAPVNASCTAAELLDDARRLNAQAVVTTRNAAVHLDLHTLSKALNCDVVFVDPHTSGPCGLFDMDIMGAVPTVVPLQPSTLHGLDDQSLILHTSGTTGKKKPADVNLNMMPLFHVSGIVRNLLTPVFSGGSTTMCAGFDAIAFWTLARDLQASWCATSSLMNTNEWKPPEGVKPTRDLRICMIANATGGLLPSLVVSLKATFGTVILPSYGMTEYVLDSFLCLPSVMPSAQPSRLLSVPVSPFYPLPSPPRLNSPTAAVHHRCMPITSLPITYQLERPGCSGLACGPHLSVRVQREPGNFEFGSPHAGGVTAAYLTWPDVRLHAYLHQHGLDESVLPHRARGFSMKETHIHWVQATTTFERIKEIVLTGEGEKAKGEAKKEKENVKAKANAEL
ncbi:hypothetical protein B0H10DRAFT_2245990 [Mycena sp. CBHHK59/15]|nr:hypothetical protein B0H10DRAFT_2245990 [Mycena sp. CBHHK59/15]